MDRCAGGGRHERQIGVASLVERGWHADDDNVHARKQPGIVGCGETTGIDQLLDLPRINIKDVRRPAIEAVHNRVVDIESVNFETGSSGFHA